MKKKLKFIFCLAFIAQMSYSQVRTTFFNDNNAKQSVNLLQLSIPDIPVIQVMPQGEDEWIEENMTEEFVAKPYVFGFGIDTLFSLNDGKWKTLEQDRLWTMRIHSPNANSLNFIFENFFLPEGAELYISNSLNNMLYGPVTSEAIPESGYFLTDVILGDEVTIYLYEPNPMKDLTSLNITRVVHGYKYSADEHPRLNWSLPCNIDINCHPEWSDEAYGICSVLLYDGTGYCSGSLLLTNDNSYKPYILTAFHCIDTDQNESMSSSEIQQVQSSMFKFNFRKTICNSSSVTNSYTYNGCKYRAGWADTDFALLEMNTVPEAKWLAWDARENSTTDNFTYPAFAIHHPRGDAMKITFCDNYLNILHTDDRVTNTVGGTKIVKAGYYIGVNFTRGASEGGSSGAPLISNSKRVIGVHTSSTGGCAPVSAYYGLLSKAWQGGGTASTRLKDWLDPQNKGGRISYPQSGIRISGPDKVGNDERVYYTLCNVGPVSGSINWTVTLNGPAYIVSGQGTKQIALGSKSSFENGIERLTVTYNGQSYSKEIYVGGPLMVSEISGPTCGLNSHTYNYIAVPSADIDAEYEWSVYPETNVISRPNGNKNSITFSTVGNYEVKCRIKDSYSDTSQDQLVSTSLMVEISNYYSAYIVNEILTIELNETISDSANRSNIRYEIYNQLTGAKSFQGEIPNLSGKNIVNLSSLSKGVYILRIYLSEDQFETIKFIL